MATRVKVSRKELLNEPDQFLSGSEKAMLYFVDNRGTVLGTIAAIIFAGSSFFGFQYYQNTQALENEALYFEMASIVDNAKGSNPASEAKTILEKIGAGKQKDRATLLLADIHFQNQEYDKAETLYSTVLDNSSKDDFNYQIAQIGMAYCSEAKKDYKQAISLFKTVIESNTGFPLYQVYWSLSRVYELSNDMSNALLILREMQIKFADDQKMDDIELRIKQLSA